MAPERNGATAEESSDLEQAKHRHKHPKRRRDRSTDDDDSTDSDHSRDQRRRKGSKRRRSRSRRRSRRSESDEEDSSSSSSYSESEDSEESEEELRRRRREKEHERDRRKRKERKRRRKEKEEKERKRKEKKKRKKDKNSGKMGAVTNSWGKYGIIRETDMWNKRPEFTAWLAEVKQVNLESLANWEEKQLFKDFMEDHNTATFPSKKYYNLDTYHQKMMVKEMKKGLKRTVPEERVVFNDEEQRRRELQIERERQKEEQVVALKRSMETGMAQAMKEQAQLREEMAYQYKLGNFEAAAAIQRRLDPDVAM